MQNNSSLPLSVFSYEMFQTYCINRAEIMENCKIHDEASYRDFINRKLDLNTGSGAYGHFVYLYKYDNGGYIYIDEELYPVIKMLNESSIKTKACCSGHFRGDHAYISFSAYNKNIQEFLQILLKTFMENKYYCNLQGNIFRWICKHNGGRIINIYDTRIAKIFKAAIAKFKKLQ